MRLVRENNDEKLLEEFFAGYDAIRRGELPTLFQWVILVAMAAGLWGFILFLVVSRETMNAWWMWPVIWGPAVIIATTALGSMTIDTKSKPLHKD